MKSYRMPVALNDEDKVFGGVLSAREFLILTGGFLAGGSSALLLPAGFWPGVLKAVLIALGLGLGAVLAFARVTARELRLDQYLVLLLTSRQAPHDYPYRGYQPPEEEGGPDVGFLAWLAAPAGRKTNLAGRPGFSRRGGH